MDKVVHFEIPADNVERAQKFYKDSFGWDINPIPKMSYTIVRTGPVDKDKMPTESGFVNGGLLKRNNVVKSPVITIGVVDVESALETIEKNGGKVVVGKTDVGGMGFSAYFKDSEGNIVGLFQSTDDK